MNITDLYLTEILSPFFDTPKNNANPVEFGKWKISKSNILSALESYEDAYFYLCIIYEEMTERDSQRVKNSIFNHQNPETCLLTPDPDEEIDWDDDIPF